jgi:hypothetical protein
VIIIIKKILILSLLLSNLILFNNCAGGTSAAAPAFQYSTFYNGTRAAGTTTGVSYKFITPVYAGRAGRAVYSGVYEWGSRFGTIITGPLAGITYFKY